MGSTTKVILLACCCLLGCSGGGTPVMEIEGPGIIGRNACAEYSVSLISISDAYYQWSVHPLNAGEFDPPNSPTTRFTATGVTSDTSARISVLVTTDQYLAVLKTKDLRILKDPGWARTWGGTVYTGG